MQKNEKGPPSHWKIKCSFLDYIQHLMIGQVIWAKNVDQMQKKQKRPPKSSKDNMFIFGLRSTSDDQPSSPSTKHQPKSKKNQKGPLSHRKIKCSFLDYVQLLMICQTIWVKNVDQTITKWKSPPKSSKIKCSFLDYVQLLLISQAIWVKNIDQNAKKKTKKFPKIVKK